MWYFPKARVYAAIFPRGWVISGLLWFASFFFSPGAAAPAIFVFGDSLSDVGNAYAAGLTALSPPNYALGRFTDGPDTVPASTLSGLWIEQLAVLLGYPVPTASSAGGGDYAFGGSTTGTGGSSTPRLGDQINQFLQANPTAPSTSIYVIWGGSGDLLQVTSAAALPAAEASAIGNLKSEITQLVAAGAKELIWVDLPPLGSSPEGLASGYSAQLNDESAKFNSDWSLAITQLRKSFRSIHLTGIDVFTPFQNIQKTPSTYGLTNVTSPSQGAAVNPDTYLFWDALHPTTAANAIFANLALPVLEANAAAQTISFAPIASQPVNAPPVVLSATSSSGLIVTFSLVSGPATLQGNSLTLTGQPGTVVVEANQTGNALYHAAPAVQQRFTVSIRPATVMLGSLTATYDGTPKPATATTNPPGLDVTFTYQGNPVAPTAPGKYAVVATITDPAYSGTARGTETISKGPAVLTLGNLNPTWTGAAQAATCTTDPPNLAVVLTYNRRAAPPVNAGTYTVVATVNDPDYAGSTTQPMTITKGTAILTLTTSASVYNGKPHTASATTDPPGLPVTISYNNSARAPVNAGTYAVNAQVTSPNAQGAQTGVLVINSAPATIMLSGLSAVANGKPHAVKATTVPGRLPVAITYDGSTTAPSAVGTYNVVATITSPNYSGTQMDTLTISAAAIKVDAAQAAAGPGSTIVAEAGGPAAGLKGATFRSFSPPVVNASGHLAFVANLAIGPGHITARDDMGIWAEDSSGQLHLIAQTGSGETGYLTLGEPVYNDNAATAFMATYLVGETVTTGIFCNSAGPLELVTQTGDQAPGCPDGVKFAAFTALALADRGGPTNKGAVVFLATLTTRGVANNTGLWAVDANGELHLAVRTGDRLDGKTITALSLLPTNSVNGPRRGDLLFLATFRDTFQALFSVQP